MNPDFTRLMQEATRLTRSGNLQAATAAIQSAWARHSEAQPASKAHPAAPAFNDDDVIEVEARVVSTSKTADSPAPATKPTPAPEPQTPSTAPHATGRFISGRHAGTGGQRDYKLYIPSQAAQGERPLPLIVMLHGCTQDPDDFARGTAMNAAAEAQGCYVLYPAQSQQANPQRCWNWFKHIHQRRGRGEPELLAGMTRAILAQHGIDPDRVYVAGLSAGGAMAAILGQAYPDLYAARPE